MFENFTNISIKSFVLGQCVIHAKHQVIIYPAAIVTDFLLHMKEQSEVSDILNYNDGVIKWKPFPRYWSFVRGSHRSSMNSPHKGQWRGALMFYLISWINGWVNNAKAGDLGRHRAHYDVTVMTREIISVNVNSDPFDNRFFKNMCRTTWDTLQK